MKPVFLICLLTALNAIQLSAQPSFPDNWDLARAYASATHVFYGEVTKVLPEPDFQTGAMGVDMEAIDRTQLPTKPIVWPKAKQLTFKVSESFKGDASSPFVAYLPDPDPMIWPQVYNAAGDLFLAQPETPGPLLKQLQRGDQVLVYVRTYFGAELPVLYRVRYGQPALDDLALLRAHQAAGGVPMEQIVKQARIQAHQQAMREAAAYKQFEDEYYSILREQDYSIRTILLKDLIRRMGFEGRWNYFDYKERYLEKYGAYVEPDEVPKTPTVPKEKLWLEISGELQKLDVLLKATKHQSL